MYTNLDRIASFRVDHTKLEPGIYVSRRDIAKTPVITTFDIRLTRPNVEPPIDQAALHTIEHLGATFLRNSNVKDYIVYFGPMGCRTGLYLVFCDCTSVTEIRKLITEMFQFICDFEGEIPGAKAEECGNYLEHNLELAKFYAERYLGDLASDFKSEYEYLSD
jgi:S-ribosylhomocysteine lyase